MRTYDKINIRNIVETTVFLSGYNEPYDKINAILICLTCDIIVISEKIF